MGRPPTKPKRFKDGFYIEVRNKGANVGMKIHFDTVQEMQEAAAMYGSSKEVIILGEHRKDRWLNEQSSREESPKKEVRVVKELPKSLKPLAKADAAAKTGKPKVETPKVEKPAVVKPKAAPVEKAKPAKAKAAKPVAAKAKKPVVKKPAAKPAKSAKKKK